MLDWELVALFRIMDEELISHMSKPMQLLLQIFDCIPQYDHTQPEHFTLDGPRGSVYIYRD